MSTNGQQQKTESKAEDGGSALDILGQQLVMVDMDEGAYPALFVGWREQMLKLFSTFKNRMELRLVGNFVVRNPKSGQLQVFQALYNPPTKGLTDKHGVYELARVLVGTEGSMWNGKAYIGNLLALQGRPCFVELAKGGKKDFLRVKSVNPIPKGIEVSFPDLEESKLVVAAAAEKLEHAADGDNPDSDKDIPF